MPMARPMILASASGVLQLSLRNDALLHEVSAELLDRVAFSFGRTLLVGPVELFVVRERMRVRSGDVGVNERRTAACATVLRCATQCLIAGKHIGPVALF